MMEELARYRCVGDDGTELVVLDRRHVHVTRGDQGARRQLGARRLSLISGAAVRYIDATTFELVETGEILRRIN
ncbi:hypothetical protein [Sphingomonas sp.]|uniref:hypothetical protein n=1 Tax=Sphingomonas sp. TaxID=28214 RepID=UPI002B8DD9E9|nr:hypothetical protein [Sphingomonas sp.]HWK34653.1 hypothetical protein [Sphingomonas sp.]